MTCFQYFVWSACFFSNYLMLHKKLWNTYVKSLCAYDNRRHWWEKMALLNIIYCVILFVRLHAVLSKGPIVIGKVTMLNRNIGKFDLNYDFRFKQFIIWGWAFVENWSELFSGSFFNETLDLLVQFYWERDSVTVSFQRFSKISM